MSIFAFNDSEALGRVKSVDTATVIVQVADVERLRKLQVNRLAVLQSSRPGQHLVGIIQKITRNAVEARQADVSREAEEDVDEQSELNLVRISLIGTMVDKLGIQSNVFLRTLETVPEIDANCFAVEGEYLTNFMRIIANVSSEGERLSLGSYTLDERAEAFLNGNKFFQRHAVIVGSTGSGKSWTTARVLECVASLPNANGIVFDIHGEYQPLSGKGIKHLRVAGSSDLDAGISLVEGVIYLPYWLLGYEALVSIFVDRSDQNAPNQAMLMSRTIIDSKRNYLNDAGLTEEMDSFTIDIPIPFSIAEVISHLKGLDAEMTPGSRGEKQGPYHGKLSRLIERLENKQTDRRLGFLFNAPAETMEFEWLDTLVATLAAGSIDQPGTTGGLKIVDFSEVPSDILPLIIRLVARLIFSVQQWTPASGRHPIALFCDEAHLYIPDRKYHQEGKILRLRSLRELPRRGENTGLGLSLLASVPQRSIEQF